MEAEPVRDHLAGSLIASSAQVDTISAYMGALDNETPDTAERLAQAAEAMSAALMQLAAAVEHAEPALKTFGAQALRAMVYAAVYELVNSPAYSTLAEIVLDFQAAEIDEAALSIAAITGRRAQDVAESMEQWLQRERDEATFLDCMAALRMETYAARFADSPARYRFPFDMAEEEARD